MFERDTADASAFALERRNFDYLPDDQAALWRRSFLGAKRGRIPGPRKLIVELLNACNLDCPMCRVGQHGVNLTRALPLDVFERVIALPSVRSVRLNGLGESTLLPGFNRYIALLHERKVGIELITNGSGASPDYADILQAGGHVLVSWDAARPAIFEQLRRPADWDDYLGRLEHIAATAAATERGRCSLIFTLQKGNIGELVGVVELAGRVGAASVQVNVAKTPTQHWVLSNWDALLQDVGLAASAARRLGIDIFLPDQVAGTALDQPGQHRTAGRHCDAPWLEAVIRWNGDVQTCNMFNPFTYGNIHRDRFEEIWRNQFAMLFREKVNGRDAHPYCLNCSYMPTAYD